MKKVMIFPEDSTQIYKITIKLPGYYDIIIYNEIPKQNSEFDFDIQIKLAIILNASILLIYLQVFLLYLEKVSSSSNYFFTRHKL